MATDHSGFLHHLQQVLDQTAHDLAVPIIERATQEFRDQMKRKVAELAISLAEVADIEHYGSKLVITVRFAPDPPVRP